MTTTVDLKVHQADCFKLLAAGFYEPDKELFMAEGLCDNLISLLTVCNCREAAEEADNMKKVLEGTNEKELLIDYARLFVGPFELAAPPYGSIYLEKSGRLMGDSTMAVNKMYSESELSLTAEEAPDHIALELEFMHYLYLLEAEAIGNCAVEHANKLRSIQLTFIKNYLAPWIPDFCDTIRKAAVNEFYIHLADCLESFIGEMTALYETESILSQVEDTHVCQASA